MLGKISCKLYLSESPFCLLKVRVYGRLMTISAGFVTSCRALRGVIDDKTVTSENLRHFASILGNYEARRCVQSCMPHLIRLSRSRVREGDKEELPSILAGRLMV
jgi:hypothetical protein